jgi:EmrB/QacA subfamily drug resistance transporter
VAKTSVAVTGIRVASARGRWILAATILGSGMVFLDGTVVNVALPQIQSDLAAPLSGLQWIVDAYALFLASLLLVGGSLGDIYGRKRLYIVGLAVFTLSSLACGLAPSLSVLIAARAVQGVGGALLVPGSLAMIQAVIAREDASRAIGTWTGLSGVSAAGGALFGGFLIHAISWRAIFVLNVPLALAAAWITQTQVPENRNPDAWRNLDWIGAAATVVGLGGLSFGLIEGPERGWTSPLVLASFVVGVAALALFPVWESRTDHPIAPLRLFRIRNFTGSNLVTLGIYFTFYGALFFVVLDLEQVLGYTPLGAGAALLPITALLMVVSPRMGVLMNRTGARLPMVVGPLVIGFGFTLLLASGRSASYVVSFLPAIIIMGLGMSIFVTPLTATVMGSVPASDVGTASGVNNAVSRVAAVLAIAVLGVIFAARFESDLSAKLEHLGLPSAARHALVTHADRLADDPIPRGLSRTQHVAARNAIQDAYISAFHWVVGSCALLCLICAGLSALLIRDAPAPP